MSNPLSHLHVHIALPEVRLHLGAEAATNGALVSEPDEVGNGSPTAYALVGDGVSLLTEEQREILAHTASLLAGEVIRVVPMNFAGLALPAGERSASNPLAVAEPEEPAPPPDPIPMTKDDFRQFGREHGYEQGRAGRAWHKVFYTAKNDPEHENEEQRSLPAIRYLGVAGHPDYGKRDDAILDLRSVQERLVASKFGLGAWDDTTKADLQFLMHVARVGVGGGPENRANLRSSPAG